MYKNIFEKLMCKNGPSSDNPLGSRCWFHFSFFVMLFAQKGVLNVFLIDTLASISSKPDLQSPKFKVCAGIVVWVVVGPCTPGKDSIAVVTSPC